MSSEALQLLNSRLSKLRAEHETRLLLLANDAMSQFDPMRKTTHRIATGALVESTGAELKAYSSRVQTEVLSLVEQLFLPLTEGVKAVILDDVAKQFDNTLYGRRFQIFEESMVRKGSGYGLKVNEWGMRTDLEAAQHHAGTSNYIRQGLAKLADDLELIRLRSTNSPVFAAATKHESMAEQANRLIKLEPNFFGIGLNLNYFIRRLFGKKE